MNMRSMLSTESLRALEQLVRSPAHKFRKKRAVKHSPPASVPQQKELPFILDVIQSVGCDTIYLEKRLLVVTSGLVIAHWTKEDLSVIQRAIEAGQFKYRKTWRNTWAVVLAC